MLCIYLSNKHFIQEKSLSTAHLHAEYYARGTGTYNVCLEAAGWLISRSVQNKCFFLWHIQTEDRRHLCQYVRLALLFRMVLLTPISAIKIDTPSPIVLCFLYSWKPINLRT